MTTLPSFVELMASLGLNKGPKSPDLSPLYASSTRSHSRSSSYSSSASPSSPRDRPVVPVSRHTRSRSNTSLKDMGVDKGAALSRNRMGRYAPYVTGLGGRRGSLPSIIYHDSDEPSTRTSSTSPCPPPSPGRRSTLATEKHSRNKFEKPLLTIPGHSVDTPISTYARRKTPSSSPISPTFPRYGQQDSPPSSPMQLSIPSLPILLPQAPTPFIFPPPPGRSSPGRISPSYQPGTLPDISEGEALPSTRQQSYRHTGVRISTSRLNLREQHNRRPYITPVA